MGWLDLPIIEALSYFSGVLGWFLSFARKYGSVIGAIGLTWTAFRLVNARIGVKEMLWDTIYKWLIYILLINCYVPLTNGIMLIANQVGERAGGGAKVIADNFGNLAKRIKEDLNSNSLESGEMVVQMTPLKSDSDDEIGLGGYGFSAESARDKMNAAESKARDRRSDGKQSMWGARTLAAIEKVLVATDKDGKPTTDYTNAYFSLSLYLKDKKGNDTPFIAPSQLMNIGMITAQIIFEKCKQSVSVETGDEDEAELKNEEGKSKFKFRNPFAAVGDSIGAAIELLANIAIGFFCGVCIVLSVAFATIQYTMTLLEFAIIQGIGAFFIPFYLFDGTKDLPKKLVPVFTGFLIKIIVITICLNFIMYMWLDFAFQQLNPGGGGTNFVLITNVLFTTVLSFMLTSNAPKIAMTLLTGQPQLSMGEFMAAVGTAVGTAAAMKNVAGTAASPLANAAKVKVGEAQQRSAAGKAAQREVESNFKEKATEGIDTSTRAGRKEANAKWNDYKKEHGEEIASAKESASSRAKENVRERQFQNYQKNGGVAGTAGRMISHYAGAALSPMQTIKSGRNYQSPNGDPIDIGKIAHESVETDSVSKNGENVPSDESQNKKKETARNGLPDNLTGGTREA